MSRPSARFTQTPNNRLRYMLDYSLELNPGETVVSMATPTIVPGTVPPSSPALVVNGVVIASDGAHVVYFVSGGGAPGTYEVQFIATTSIGQILEDVVVYTILGDL